MRHAFRSVSSSLQETAYHHHFFREGLYYNRDRPIFFRAANLPAGFSRTAVPDLNPPPSPTMGYCTSKSCSTSNRIMVVANLHETFGSLMDLFRLIPRLQGLSQQIRFCFS